MSSNLKALVVVLTIAAIVFAVAKPVCLRFMAENDYVRRRNIWFALTIAAFVSPSFWLFAAVAFPLLAWGASKDPNPVALYLIAFCVIPPTISIHISLSEIGINELFNMTLGRLIAFAILIPVAWRLIHSKDNRYAIGFTTMDMFMLAFAVLQLVSWIPYESGTNTLRRGFLYFMDVVVLYFVASRACSNRQAIVESLATFCLLCAILAPVAVFEAQRHWLLYVEQSFEWGAPIVRAYLERDGILRAQVSAGHSLPLGYLLAVGFGFSLYLSSRVRSRQWTVAVGIWMWAGMIGAYSRGPWVAAVAIFLAGQALGPKGVTQFIKASIVMAVAAGFLLVSPIGERVVDSLPFIGTIDKTNVEYRKEVAKLSWELVKENPVFGNPLVLMRLESLRQGEGIIDIVNTFAQIAMFYGLTGLFFYLGPYFIGIWKVYRLSRRSASLDPDLSLLGAALISCILGLILAMAMGGFGTAVSNLAVVVVGLAAGYARLNPFTGAAPAEPLRRPRTQPQWNMRRG